MNVVVFGATGGTGRAVVERALEAGHGVTAVVRRGDAFPVTPGLRVVVVPDLARLDEVTAAVRGQDVVISALGTNAKGPVSVCADGVRSILAAMGDAGVRRLIAVSAHGAAETHDRSLYSLALWASVGDKMRDKEAMEELIRASDVDWTIVRPPALKDKPRTGAYRTGPDLPIRLTSAISRADLADFLLREATTPVYVNAFPRIAA
ncbi:SDR family oxidoreductase [Umezawaea sp. Da 62-37]|uniref:NAD(P)-dependent oxidoreductase n=1 Tax=Umezawaea sp. Da 62-37 TaxID=3075927 RepID=UPI0028F6EFF9|nr:SDR family oxidoreductase [Umezawaea sp. Da 62-37]WNV85847.1 SDR family oxidoreductase [Umezawaea sp. Da 62-37]